MLFNIFAIDITLISSPDDDDESDRTFLIASSPRYNKLNECIAAGLKVDTQLDNCVIIV